MDHTLPELKRSTTSYIYKEDGTIIQTVDKIVYNESHLLSNDFLSFINVDSLKVSNKPKKEAIEMMTPPRSIQLLERKTVEPPKRTFMFKKKTDI